MDQHKPNAPCVALAVTLGAFLFDQLTKAIAERTPTLPTLFPPIITLLRHQNFGLLADTPAPLWMIIGVSLGVAGVVAWLGYTEASRGRMLRAMFLALVVGGALGNALDRIRLGYVFDWIYAYGGSVMNLADIFIIIGAVGYVWCVWRGRD